MAPAVAANQSDLWYFEESGMASIHERTTGKGIKIAVIDTAIWPDAPDLRGASLRVHEPSYCADGPLGEPLPAAQKTPAAAHGTGMVSLVVGTGEGINGQPGTVGVAPDADILFYSSLVRPDGRGDNDKCYPPTPEAGLLLFGNAINQAIADGADIISISLSNDSPTDFPAIARALNAGKIIVAAVAENGDRPYPASYNGVVSVDSINQDLQIRDNARPYEVDVVAPGERVRQINEDLKSYSAMNGASNAAAYTAGALALVWSAYPNATGNQIIQSLVRNTNVEDHEIYRDDYYGHGFVNVRHMLEHDPTAYPDVNPLVEAGPHALPSLEHIADPSLAEKDAGWEDLDASAVPTPESSAAPLPSASPREPAAHSTEDGGSIDSQPVPLLAGIGAAVLAVGAATALKLARKSRSIQAHSSTHQAGTTNGVGMDPHDGGK